MELVEVGWVLKGDTEPKEFLVRMSEVQRLEVERALKEAYADGRVKEYWLADAIVLPFRAFKSSFLRE